MSIEQIWRDHSLTIVLTGVSAVCLIIALMHERDHRGWDVWLGLFHAAIGIALLNLLAGPFRERNKPDQ
jgi:uncharacterized membrane protein